MKDISVRIRVCNIILVQSRYVRILCQKQVIYVWIKLSMFLGRDGFSEVYFIIFIKQNKVKLLWDIDYSLIITVAEFLMGEIYDF